MKTKEFSILDINTVKADVKALLKQYEEKGFFLANVRYNIEQLDKENVKLKVKKVNYKKKVVSK